MKTYRTYLFSNAITILAMLLVLSCGKEDTKPNPTPTPTPAAITAEVQVFTNDLQQIIRGFGCATVFNPPGTAAITPNEFDRLFGSGIGQVGLSILRIRVATDDAWRNTELNYAKAAIQRGAKIIACPWSPPAAMKTNNSLIGGKLKPDSSAAFAQYLQSFANYMQANGAPIYALSVQNEPDWDPSYEGCVWTATEMRDFIKNHGATLSGTKLMAPDLVNNNQAYINTLLADEAAANNLDILSTHLYGGGMVENTTAKAKSKEVWMTEHLDTLVTHTACMNTAVEIHDCLSKANFNAYVWWYGKRFYGLIGQDGQVTKRGFIVSQFSRFIKDGFQRLGTGVNSRSEVLVSAYKNGNKKVVVLINKGTQPISQKVIFQDGAIASAVPYTTSELKNAEQGTSIQAAGNTITCILPPASVVTLVE